MLEQECYVIRIKKIIVAIDPGIIRVGFAVGEIDIEIDLSRFHSLEKKNEEKEDNPWSFYNNLIGLSETQLVKRYVQWHVSGQINLVELVSTCNREKCQLQYHSNEMVDRVNHFLQAFPILQSCDLLLIERQQPGACTDVQNLLMNLLDRKKIQFIAANTRNKEIGSILGVTDRMARKKLTVTRVLKWFNAKALEKGFWNVQEWIALCSFKEEEEKNKDVTKEQKEIVSQKLIDDTHDAADAIFMIVMKLKQEIWPSVLKQTQMMIRTLSSQQRQKRVLYMNGDDQTDQTVHIEDFLEEFRFQPQLKKSKDIIK
jgi:hypothetical protein